MSPGKQMLENSSPGGAWESGVTVGGPLCFPFHLVAMRKSFLLVQNILFLFVDYFLLIEEKHDLSALNLFPLHLA